MESEEYKVLVNIEKAITRVETKLENTVTEAEFAAFKSKVNTWGAAGLMAVSAISYFI